MGSKSIMTTTHKMTNPTNDTAKALQLNGSPDNSPRSPSAEDQRIPLTLTGRLRSIIASPRWRLIALISMMLFVGSSAADDNFLAEFNGVDLSDSDTDDSAPPKIVVVNGAGN